MDKSTMYWLRRGLNDAATRAPLHLGRHEDVPRISGRAKWRYGFDQVAYRRGRQIWFASLDREGGV